MGYYYTIQLSTTTPNTKTSFTFHKISEIKKFVNLYPQNFIEKYYTKHNHHTNPKYQNFETPKSNQTIQPELYNITYKTPNNKIIISENLYLPNTNINTIIFLLECDESYPPTILNVQKVTTKNIPEQYWWQIEEI